MPGEPSGRPMAKKKKTDSESDEIISKLDEDMAAESEPVVPASAKTPRNAPREFRPWPIEDDHGSARDVLLGKGASEVADLGDDDFKSAKSGLNLILLILLLGVAGVGIWQFQRVSSQETLDAKRMAREAAEQAHLEKQQEMQKKYGILRIETNPPQAVVFKDGEKIVTKNAAGEELAGKTPMNMMDLDIAQTFKIKVELDGYDPFEFGVAPHLWTKDAGSGEYKFFKLIDLTPNICEYWFLYDAKARKELKFDEKVVCMEHFDGASAKGTSVTECTCKIPPEGWTPPEKKGDKDKKKGK
jgi:hypothetical protein